MGLDLGLKAPRSHLWAVLVLGALVLVLKKWSCLHHTEKLRNNS